MDNLQLVERMLGKVMECLCGSGLGPDHFDVEDGGILDDDEDRLSILVDVTPKPIETDDGLITPSTTTLQVDMDKDSGEVMLITGEDTEWDLTYGNLYAAMYWSNCGEPVSANQVIQG